MELKDALPTSALAYLGILASAVFENLSPQASHLLSPPLTSQYALPLQLSPSVYHHSCLLPKALQTVAEQNPVLMAKPFQLKGRTGQTPYISNLSASMVPSALA